MPKIHPSFITRMSIDSRLYTEALAQDIKRNFNYVGVNYTEPVSIETQELQNTIQIDVILHRNYWGADAEGAEELWAGDLGEWLKNIVYKVSNNITARNTTSLEYHEPIVDFTWAEFRFGENGLFRFKTQKDCSIAKDTVDVIIAGRKLIVSGALGENVSSICIPSPESYAAQRDAIMAEAAAQKADEQAAAETTDEALTEPVQTGDDMDTTAEETEITPEASEEKAAAEAINFDPDTTIWGVEYADGTRKQYDSVAGSFLA